MARFHFVVNGENLEILSPTKGLSDNLNVNSAVFDFRGSDWDDAVKWVHFYNPEQNDGAPYDFMLIEDKISPERGLNLPAGIWDVYLHGEITGEVSDTIGVVKRLVTSTVSIEIEQSGYGAYNLASN